jgi:hypothetical protein
MFFCREAILFDSDAVLKREKHFKEKEKCGEM